LQEEVNNWPFVFYASAGVSFAAAAALAAFGTVNISTPKLDESSSSAAPPVEMLSHVNVQGAGGSTPRRANSVTSATSRRSYPGASSAFGSASRRHQSDGTCPTGDGSTSSSQQQQSAARCFSVSHDRLTDARFAGEQLDRLITGPTSSSVVSVV
jgi:hypothetical protein